MYDENPTPYVKPSQKATPRKANHAHEYVRPFTLARLIRFDGTLTTDRHKLTLTVSCIVCGAVKRRGARDVVEVEVSLSEYRRLKA